MKVSNKPTRYLLLNGNTNSEGDNCAFAIIRITEEWKEQQSRRLPLAKSFKADYNFCFLTYYDTAVDFFATDDNGQPDVEEMLAGKQWIYIEVSEDELETLPVPENTLDGYSLLIYADGTAYYEAYGKHTSEKFWTEQFNLDMLCSELSDMPVTQTEL